MSVAARRVGTRGAPRAQIESGTSLNAQITPAAPELLPRLAELRAQMEMELEGDDLDLRLRGWRERFVEFFLARQQRGMSQPFVALGNEEVVGMAMASVVDDYRTFSLQQLRGYVNAVYVVPAERGHGLGRSLTQAAIAWLRDRGCVAVRLNPSRQAETLYRAMGFVPSGELKLGL
jgi:GNAT superfamily N-acetyltransferase